MIIYNINTETEAGFQAYNNLIKTDSSLFKELEKQLDKFLEKSPEDKAKYFSEDAIYCKKLAIIEAIDQILEVMDENNLPFIFLNDSRIDLGATFQD